MQLVFKALDLDVEQSIDLTIADMTQGVKRLNRMRGVLYLEECLISIFPYSLVLGRFILLREVTSASSVLQRFL